MVSLSPPLADQPIQLKQLPSLERTTTNNRVFGVGVAEAEVQSEPEGFFFGSPLHTFVYGTIGIF